jgi:hypothetical protein
MKHLNLQALHRPYIPTSPRPKQVKGEMERREGREISKEIDPSIFA